MLNSRVPVSLADAEVTLSGVIQAQPAGTTHLPLPTALQLSLEVVRMVAATHDRGEIVGVLDAAHLVCRSSGTLAFGRGSGNPIAPELARGDRPDRLSDVYSLGALVYRLLTGRKIDRARLIEPPSHFNPAVDSSLDELVIEMLDEDPSERPYSAREVERRLLEIFGELGLEPDPRAEASRLVGSAAVKPKPAAAPVVARTAMIVDDEDDDDVPERPAGGVSAFLYDLGWVKPDPAWAKKRVPLGAEDEPLSTSEHSKKRNRLSQFMYDLGWLQSIDWDAPKTLLYLKRGGIGLAVLLLAIVVWPSHKAPRLNAAQAALVAQVEKENAPAASAPKAKPVIVKAQPAGKTKKR